MDRYGAIVHTLLSFFPALQAAYLFGSYGTEFEREESGIDVAVLLPPGQANTIGQETLLACASQLARELGKSVDLVNLRRVDTVFQRRILETGRVMFCADTHATQLFEMMTISAYQKLQEEQCIDLANHVIREIRNILIHEYQDMDIYLMEDVIRTRLNDMIEFTNALLKI